MHTLPLNADYPDNRHLRLKIVNFPDYVVSDLECIHTGLEIGYRPTPIFFNEESGGQGHNSIPGYRKAISELRCRVYVRKSPGSH